MRPNLRILGLMAIFFLPNITHALFIEADSINGILRHVKKGAWVVTDLDNTFMQAKQAYGHVDWFYEECQNNVAKNMSLDDATLAVYPEWAAVQAICPVKPVEENFISALRALQTKDYVVMALTHRRPLLAEATLRQIGSMDFTFATTARGPSHTFIPADPAAFYQDGVVMTGEYHNKGEIFIQFLELIDEWPLEMIYIDDKKLQVENVLTAVTQKGINCIGIHYTGLDLTQKIYDSNIARFQRKVWAENREAPILTNEEARNFMQYHGLPPISR